LFSIALPFQIEIKVIDFMMPPCNFNAKIPQHLPAADSIRIKNGIFESDPRPDKAGIENTL
jgi:hypothetical protein